MASYLARNWVTFEEEEEYVNQENTGMHQSKPWTISKMNNNQSNTYLSGSFSSISSGSTSSRGMSPPNFFEDSSRWVAVKAPETPPVKHNEEETPELCSNSSSDARYSVFYSLRESERKGEYLGWSKVVMGEGAMGWSESLWTKH